MKKTWIIILALAMMMTVVLATACGEEEAPAPETPEPEPITADPADDDDELQKGGSGLSDGFDLAGADFKAVGELGEADDAQFKINPNNIESARP